MYACNLYLSLSPLDDVDMWDSNSHHTDCVLGRCMSHDYCFIHVTLKDFIENTVHEVLFLLKQFLGIFIMSRHVMWIQDFFTTVCCGRHQKIFFEYFKVFLILENGVLRDFSFDALFEVH